MNKTQIIRPGEGKCFDHNAGVSQLSPPFGAISYGMSTASTRHITSADFGGSEPYFLGDRAVAPGLLPRLFEASGHLRDRHLLFHDQPHGLLPELLHILLSRYLFHLYTSSLLIVG